MLTKIFHSGQTPFKNTGDLRWRYAGKRCLVRVAGQRSRTSAHGGHLTTGSSVTHNVLVVVGYMYFLDSHNLLKVHPIFQVVWFGINVKYVVMTVHT